MKKPSDSPIGMCAYFLRIPALRNAKVHWSGSSLVVIGKFIERSGEAASEEMQDSGLVMSVEAVGAGVWTVSGTVSLGVVFR